jgi:hypothetical protein
MAAESGNAAEIKIDATSIKTSSKSVKLSIKGNTGDYVVFGDKWENSVPTGQSWELSVDAVLDSNNVFSTLFGKLGTDVAISVYPQGNTSGKKYYTGNAVLTGLDNDMPADDLIGISISLKGNGALTENTVV